MGKTGRASSRAALRRSALISVVVGTLLTTSSATAFADSEVCTSDSGCAGRATFTTADQVFTVFDQKADGYAAVAVYWLADGNTTQRAWAHNGNGTSVTHDIELAAGNWVTYKVCLGDYGDRHVVNETCGTAVTEVV